MTEKERVAKDIDGIIRDKRYFIKTKYGDGKNIQWEQVAGTKVKNDDGLDLFRHYTEKWGWTISEGKTGLRIASASTEKYCRENLVEKLKQHPVTWFDKNIPILIQDHGASPRYILIENSLIPVKLLEKANE